MSAYGNVSYKENDDIATEKVTEEFVSNSTIDEQVNKFDTSYTIEKLQELYNEYDKITIDESKLKSVVQVKTNAVSKAVPFRVCLTLTTVAIVALLLVFLCIYNITVLNGMSTNINYLQEEVAQYEYELVKSEGLYESLTNPENIKAELSDMGYSEVPSSNVVAITVPDKTEVVELQADTNWFDAVCNFLSQIFG